MATNDGSEDVNDFLLRIRELGDQRDREDEERTRKLEEEILQGRKERQARRAGQLSLFQWMHIVLAEEHLVNYLPERARSISPTKEPSSNAGTPTSVRSTADNVMNGEKAKSPVTFDPRKPSLEEAAKDMSRNLNEGPSKENRPLAPRTLPQPPSKSATLNNTSPNTGMPPSRSGTFSWQQRPTSRGFTGPRARPLSQIAAENGTSRSPRASAEPPSTSEREMSRDQIAESLSSKDPAWFRQTHERGLGSAAYRRNQEDTTSDTASVTGSMRLPGMSRESTVEPEWQGSPIAESVRSLSPSRTDSVRGGSVRQSINTNSTSISSSDGARPPIPSFASPTFEPPSCDFSTQGKDSSFSRGMAMSPSQGRISPERLDRPASPTKGLGGFVQSAMLKRSDSVNKRWSAKPGTGLSRGNSIASNRSGYEGPKFGIPNLNAPKEQMPPASSREPSPLAASRPSSSHGTAMFSQSGKESDKPSLPSSAESAKQIAIADVGPVKLVRPHEILPSNLPKPDEESKVNSTTQSSPPSSPSKRWSPTKSSWLENAINKPDSPKPKMPPPQQPSWMTNLNQAKQRRGSVDLSKGGIFKDVSTSGLLRSPPMGAVNKPPSIGGLPRGFSAGVTSKPRLNGIEPLSTSSSIQVNKLQDKDDEESRSESTPEISITNQPTDAASVEADPTTTASSRSLRGVSVSGIGGNVDPLSRSPKAKPETPPKKDFRSNLRPRQTSGEKKRTEDPEFKNVFGKLKRTQTKNYIAPDELKGNILRGKAGLATTGGPNKTERRDEFKESLLKQKEAMKAGPPPSTGRKPSTGETTKDRTPSTPEALAKRSDLTKSESNSSISRIETVQTRPQPGAIARFKSLEETPQPTPSEAPQQKAVKSPNTPLGNGRLGSDFNSSLAGVLSRGRASLISSNRSIQNAAIEDGQADNISQGQVSSHEASEGPQLTHMTKSRARGPKRRLPTISTATDEQKPQEVLEPTPADLSLVSATSRSESKAHLGPPNTTPDPQSRPLASISNNHRKPSQPQTPRKPSLNLKNPEVSSLLSPDSKNTAFTKSPRTSSSPSTKPNPLSPGFQRIQRPLTATPKPSDSPRTPSGRIDHEKPVDHARLDAQPQLVAQEESPLPSVKSAAISWNQSGRQERPSQSRTRSPIKLPTRKDEEAAMEDAGLIRKEEAPIGLGINSAKQEPRITAPAIHDLPTPPLASPKSPPMPAKKPPSIVNRIVSSAAVVELPPKVNGSPTTQTPEAVRLFAELFDESPTTDMKVNIDTPAVLASRASTSGNDKIRTLRKQSWEVTPGGKLIPVPPDQSHILFENGLYIYHHVFGSLAGTRTTEVYLWSGDGVATSAIEDAQIFARKEAKDHVGTLIVLQQGKETSNFFQALGGILVTRHGQSDRASSKYMLCGRRHVGHIAFDEVEFSPQNLCKGYPYLVSSGTGKVHLWKGIGSGIDELACARLIGMDLGVRGEIEEVEDGKEPEAFWKLFPDSVQQRQQSWSPSKHWHLKSSIEQYTTRLYQVDIEIPRPKSSGSFWGRRGSAPTSTPVDENAPKWNAVTKEIMHFAQSDVFNDGVFVLDTFFEVFVFVLFPHIPLGTNADINAIVFFHPFPPPPSSSPPFEPLASSRRNTPSSPPRARTRIVHSFLKVSCCFWVLAGIVCRKARDAPSANGMLGKSEGVGS